MQKDIKILTEKTKKEINITEQNALIHNHLYQVLLYSEKELITLLKENWIEDNLLYCITNKTAEDYDKKLFLVALKFSLVSEYIFIDKNGKFCKSEERIYRKYLFDCYIENKQELESRLDETTVIGNEIELYFKTYRLIREFISRYCAGVESLWIYENIYYIDYIIKNADKINKLYKSKNDRFPSFIPYPKDLENRYDYKK